MENGSTPHKDGDDQSNNAPVMLTLIALLVVMFWCAFGLYLMGWVPVW